MKKKRNGAGKRMLTVLCALLGAALAAWAALAVCVHVCEKAERPLEKRDAVIVLGARVMEDGTLSTTLEHRIETGYAVYHEGFADALIVCGARGADEPTSEAEAMAAYLRGRGVPEGAIFTDGESYDTIGNLANARAIMEERGWTKAILVTSDYHLTRALWLCADAGIDAVGAGAPGPDLWYNRVKARAREALSWVNYFSGGAIRRLLGGA